MSRTTVSVLFLVESALLCLLGAAGGAALGAAVTLGCAATRPIPPVLPLAPVLAGLASSLVVGLSAGV